MTEEECMKECQRLADEFEERDPDDIQRCDLCAREKTVDKFMLVLRVEEDYSTPPVAFHVCLACHSFYDGDEDVMQAKLEPNN